MFRENLRFLSASIAMPSCMRLVVMNHEIFTGSDLRLRGRKFLHVLGHLL